jgi:hypothetical protein
MRMDCPDAYHDELLRQADEMDRLGIVTWQECVSSRRFWPFFALPLAPILFDISLPFSAFSHVRWSCLTPCFRAIRAFSLTRSAARNPGSSVPILRS